MEYRFLGNSGLKVSALGLGGWVTFGHQVSQDVTNECIRVAFESGINFFDCAETYAGGQSEIDMGIAIKTFGWKRSELVISTKIFWGGKGPNDRGLSRKHIVEGLDACLQRLQLDYVDLVFAHRPDPNTPIEETVRAFNHVIDKGKAFYWGTSEWSAQQITEAMGIANRLGLIGPLMEQQQYNMFHRDRTEKEYLPLFKNFGLGCTTWSPLFSGILTGKYNDGIPPNSRLAQENEPAIARIRKLHLSPEGQKRVEKIRALEVVAKRLECTVAQLALAWALSNPNVSSVITGASQPQQIEENVVALYVCKLLTPEIIEDIEAILQNKPTPDYNFRSS